MVQEIDVLADFHAALLSAFPHGDLSEGAHRRSRHRLAAQAFECSQSPSAPNKTNVLRSTEAAMYMRSEPATLA